MIEHTGRSTDIAKDTFWKAILGIREVVGHAPKYRHAVAIENVDQTSGLVPRDWLEHRAPGQR